MPKASKKQSEEAKQVPESDSDMKMSELWDKECKITMINMLTTITEMKNTFGWQNGGFNVAEGRMNKLEEGSTKTYQNDTHRGKKKWDEKEKK